MAAGDFEEEQIEQRNGVTEMKPICVRCQRFYRCIKNNFPFIEGMPIGDSDLALPGTATPYHWKPYKIWNGDKWQCPGCGSEIVVGCASEPIAEHYQTHFDRAMAALKPQLIVNDC